MCFIWKLAGKIQKEIFIRKMRYFHWDFVWTLIICKQIEWTHQWQLATSWVFEIQWISDPLVQHQSPMWVYCADRCFLWQVHVFDRASGQPIDKCDVRHVWVSQHPLHRSGICIRISVQYRPHVIRSRMEIEYNETKMNDRSRVNYMYVCVWIKNKIIMKQSK